MLGDISSEDYIRDGSTYGTCWDDNGPTEEQADYFEFHPTLLMDKMKPLFDFFGIDGYELNLDEHQDFLFDEYETEEGDYYGGCSLRVRYDLNNENLVRLIVSKKFGYDNITKEEFEEKHPELFLN